MIIEKKTLLKSKIIYESSKSVGESSKTGNKIDEVL